MDIAVAAMPPQHMLAFVFLSVAALLARADVYRPADVGSEDIGAGKQRRYTQGWA